MLHARPINQTPVREYFLQVETFMIMQDMIIEELTVDELREIILEESRNFVRALVQGEPWESVKLIRDRVKRCTQLLDIKRMAEATQNDRSN